MKVIHVVGSLDISAGGPSRSVPQTCEYLSKIGVDIEIYTRPSENPVQIIETPTYKVSFKNFRQLFLDGFKLSKNEVDLIHLQHVWDPYVHLMAWFARLKGIPYVVTPRGMLEPWIMEQRPLKKKMGRALYLNKDLKKAETIHVTCDLEKRNITNLGFKAEKVNIPNGVEFSTVPKPKRDYGTKKIVFLSRIHEKKGIEILIDAWKQVVVDNKDWVLEIAGEGEKTYVNKIKNKINNQKILNVSLVGGKYGDAKWDFIKEGDVFILPTFSENFGIVVAEALAVGVPVITTTGTPWEELNTRDCGWWIDLSVDNLKNTLLIAINTSENELEMMGVRGRKLIEENYDVVQVANKLKRVYENII